MRKDVLEFVSIDTTTKFQMYRMINKRGHLKQHALLIEVLSKNNIFALTDKNLFLYYFYEFNWKHIACG